MALPTIPSIPQLPAIDDTRAPNAVKRKWILDQLGPLAVQNDAGLENIKAGAKLGLAGYGGWGFGPDDPNTVEREDLKAAFDPSKGPGEREKSAFRGEVNQANSRGTLYSSFTNQNLASAAQRLSLEAQQIVNQYAGAINAQQTGYATQVSGLVGQWVGLYGDDAMYLVDHPPPTPAPPPPPPGNTGPGTGFQGTGGSAPVPGAVSQDTRQWTGSAPPNLKSLGKQWGVDPHSIHVSRTPDGKYIAWLL